jgi:hypothetical protein
MGTRPRVHLQVGDLDLEDYEEVQIGEIDPAIVSEKKKKKVLLGLPAVPSLAQLTVSLMYRGEPRHSPAPLGQKIQW